MNDFAPRVQNQRVTFEAGDRAYVYAVARRILGSAEDAEDVTQDTLVLAYRYRNTFRGESRYRTWLHRIAVTTALSHLRRQRRAPVTEYELADSAKSPVVLLAEAEDRAAMQRALEQLHPSYREVLLERADASEPEVARRLGISVANVKIRAHRGRKQLRQVLKRLEMAA